MYNIVIMIVILPGKYKDFYLFFEMHQQKIHITYIFKNSNKQA